MISSFPVSKCSRPGSSSFPVSLSLSSTWLECEGPKCRGGRWRHFRSVGPEELDRAKHDGVENRLQLNLMSADLLCNRLVIVHVNMLSHSGDLFCGVSI